MQTDVGSPACAVARKEGEKYGEEMVGDMAQAAQAAREELVKDFEARLAEAKAAQAEAEAAAEAQREALFATIGAKGEGSEVKEAQIDPSSDANAGMRAAAAERSAAATREQVFELGEELRRKEEENASLRKQIEKLNELTCSAMITKPDTEAFGVSRTWRVHYEAMCPCCKNLP